LYGWKLFGFESHGFAAMGKIFIPRNIVMFAFMAVYHFVLKCLNLSRVGGFHMLDDKDSHQFSYKIQVIF